MKAHQAKSLKSFELFRISEVSTHDYWKFSRAVADLGTGQMVTCPPNKLPHVFLIKKFKNSRIIKINTGCRVNTVLFRFHYNFLL